MSFFRFHIVFIYIGAGALVGCTVSLLTNQTHLLSVDRCVAVINELDASLLNVPLHDGLGNGVGKSLAHIFRIVLTASLVNDHAV